MAGKVVYALLACAALAALPGARALPLPNRRHLPSMAHTDSSTAATGSADMLSRMHSTLGSLGADLEPLWRHFDSLVAEQQAAPEPSAQSALPTEAEVAKEATGQPVQLVAKRRKQKHKKEHSQTKFDPSTDYALVYTLASTGSSSVAVPILEVMLPYLEESAANSTLYGDINRTWDFLAEKYWKAIPQEKYGRFLKTNSVWVARDFIAKVPQGSRIWIFTSVRDPFAREMSDFFRGIENRYNLTQEGVKEMGIEKLQQFFKDTQWFRHPKNNSDMWYRHAFNGITGINLIHHKFNPNEGRMMFRRVKNGHKLVVVLLRSEDSLNWNQTMSDILPEWRTIHTRRGNTAWYKKLYKQFRTNFSFPPDIADVVKASDLMHFYEDHEQKDFLEKAT